MDVDQLMHRSTFVSGSCRKFTAKGCLFFTKVHTNLVLARLARSTECWNSAFVKSFVTEGDLWQKNAEPRCGLLVIDLQSGTLSILFTSMG
jgi:hypothetical protein